MHRDGPGSPWEELSAGSTAGQWTERGFSHEPYNGSAPKSSWLQFKAFIICVISLFMKMVPGRWSQNCDRR